MSIIKRVRIGRSSSQGRSQASLARSSAIMASGTLVSRILGMVRNALIVMALGATGSGAADAFNTANNLPTYLYNMMIGGILNAILVPQIVQALRRRNGEEVVNRLLTAAATLMLAVTCIATAAAPLIFTLNANSLAQGQWRTLSFAFAFWFMPQVFFYGLYALWGQVLNARSSFGPYMWSPVLNNIISIASILFYLHIYGRYTTGESAEVWDWGRITLIGATTTLGIAVQALILYIPLVRSGFRPRIIFGVRGLGLGKTVKVALWALAGVGVASLSNWITSNLGSYAVTASEQPEYANVIVPSTTMWLNAYLVYMLPQSLVVTSIITALFTRMSEKAAAGDAAGVREDLSLGLRSAGVFTVLATAGICVLAVPALQPLDLPARGPGQRPHAHRSGAGHRPAGHLVRDPAGDAGLLRYQAAAAGRRRRRRHPRDPVRPGLLRRPGQPLDDLGGRGQHDQPDRGLCGGHPHDALPPAQPRRPQDRHHPPASHHGGGARGRRRDPSQRAPR